MVNTANRLLIRRPLQSEMVFVCVCVCVCVCMCVCVCAGLCAGVFNVHAVCNGSTLLLPLCSVCPSLSESYCFHY